MKLDANGDRVAADAAVYNAQPSSTSASGYEEVTIGSVVGGVFAYDAAMATPPVLYFMGTMSSVIPAATVATAADGNGTDLVAPIVGTVAAVTLLVIAGIVASRLLAPKGRDNSAAPTDGAKPFAIVFTDIQSSTALWARSPEAMSDAVEQHHEIMRRCLAENGGYEVKTLGDSFMIAFQHAAEAVQFSLDAQTALHRATWRRPDVFAAVYEECAIALAAERNEKVPPGRINDISIWQGLRVRIGVHYGMGNVTKDEVTLGYDYYGTVVNTAARVEAAANGGQTVVTEAVADALGAVAVAAPAIKVVALGLQILRGLEEPVPLSQLLPRPLALRSFPPLRLDRLVDDDKSESAQDSAQSDNASVASFGSAAGGGGRYVLNTAVERGAKKFVRQHKWGAAMAPGDVHARMVQEHAFLKTVLSTTPEAERAKMVTRWAEKWRCGAVDKKLMASPAYFDDALLGVVARSMRALAANKQLVLGRAADGDGDGELSTSRAELSESDYQAARGGDASSGGGFGASANRASHPFDASSSKGSSAFDASSSKGSSAFDASRRRSTLAAGSGRRPSTAAAAVPDSHDEQATTPAESPGADAVQEGLPADE
jgi:class 3 adenylate cyclase